MLELQHKLDTLINSREWLPSYNSNNDGGVGNTLEHYLGIKENNSPLPDIGNIEIKTSASKSLLTLGHKEPVGRAEVGNKMVNLFGWGDNKSFRVTVNNKTPAT